jgi:hypothetical protein
MFQLIFRSLFTLTCSYSHSSSYDHEVSTYCMNRNSTSSAKIPLHASSTNCPCFLNNTLHLLFQCVCQSASIYYFHRQQCLRQSFNSVAHMVEVTCCSPAVNSTITSFFHCLIVKVLPVKKTCSSMSFLYTIISWTSNFSLLLSNDVTRNWHSIVSLSPYNWHKFPPLDVCLGRHYFLATSSLFCIFDHYGLKEWIITVMPDIFWHIIPFHTRCVSTESYKNINEWITVLFLYYDGTSSSLVAAHVFWSWNTNLSHSPSTLIAW